MTVPASHPILPDWPADQPYIVTRPGEKFLRFIDLTRTLPHKTHYPTMAIIIGDAGLGKTYTVRHYAATLPSRRHTGLPACIALTLERDTTKRYLTELLLRELRMVPVGRSGFPLLDQATSAILCNDLELIIVDEADFLKEDTFELLRRVFDRTGCPIVLVGLPKLLHVVHVHEKFRSRMSMIHQFLPPQRREMLTTVLGQLVLPRWQYDPANAEDSAMGAFAWDSIVPLLRNLRSLLQVASLIAEERDAPTIQREHIAEALTLTTIPVAAPTDQMATPLQMTDSPKCSRSSGKRPSGGSAEHHVMRDDLSISYRANHPPTQREVWRWLVPFAARFVQAPPSAWAQPDPIPWATLRTVATMQPGNVDQAFPPLSNEVWTLCFRFTGGRHGQRATIAITWEILARIQRQRSASAPPYDTVWCLCAFARHLPHVPAPGQYPLPAPTGAGHRTAAPADVLSHRPFTCNGLCAVTSFPARSVLPSDRLHRDPRYASRPTRFHHKTCGHFVALFVQSRPTLHTTDQYRSLTLTERCCYPKVSTSVIPKSPFTGERLANRDSYTAPSSAASPSSSVVVVR